MHTATQGRESPGVTRLATIVATTVLCGGAFQLLIDIYLFPHWLNLGWGRPIAEWLVAIGCGDTVAAYSGLVWDRLPEWMIAVLLGVCAGLCLRKKWPIGAIPCALAFAFTSDLFLLLAGEEHPAVLFGFRVVIRTALWELPSIVLLVLAASASSRIENGSKLEGGS